ncbi:Sterile alpha motif, type 2 [Phaffia rhodozyma]|uniref:Sterile alpha motif, type 2 n=1 Tax=Phaffia rhodozyma TaxID=264483 RepID=A0A0F7SG51_PHARH|nr:Sterile alpha motif, type 2 [Phaffia rhodozyma]
MESLQRTFLEWQEDQVASWVESIGFPNHTDSIHQHGITGDVLSVISSEDLRDVGITSLGQRLSILKHVYQLKLEQGIPLEKDSWIPSTLDGEEGVEASFLNLYSEAGSSPNLGSAADALDIEKLYRIVNEQNERLYYLEQEHQRLQGTILQSLPLQPTAPTPTSSGPPPAPSSYTNLPISHSSSAHQDFMVKRQPSFKWATFGKRSPTIMSTPAFFDPTTSASRQASMNFGGSNAVEHWSERSGSPGIELGVTPPRTAPLARHQPPLTHTISVQAYPQATSPSIPTHPSIPHFSTSSSATSPTDQSRQAPGLNTSSSKKTDLDIKESEEGRRDEKERARKSSRSTSSAVLGTAENPQRFKVTLEDPCWKVLPAALKKYKINDDWRMYALFICYGNTSGTGTGTERCLSYDEKPLLLFQKLKEASQSPVFMLRHIRDIKSPIAIAQSKVQSRQITTASADNSTSSSENLSSQGNTSAPQASSSSNSHPSASVYAKTNRPAEGTNRDAGPSSSSNKTGITDGVDGVTYAISIYPYAAEREDEFSVNVDDTFIVLAKAKGWWVVQCDPQSAGRVPVDVSKAGWVPAGCLLECSRPPGLSFPSLSPSLPSSPSFLSPPSDVTPPGSSFTTPTPSSPAISSSPTSAFGTAQTDRSNHQQQQQRLQLDSILSTSFPGVVLMDYASGRPEEMSLKKDETVWMFKRYSHWSYAVKNGTGERGWVPSWFISSQHTTSTTPTTTSAPSSTLSTGLTTYQSTPSSGTSTPSTPLTSSGPTSTLSLSGHIPPTMSVGSAMSTPTMEIVPGGGSEILV